MTDRWTLSDEEWAKWERHFDWYTEPPHRGIEGSDSMNSMIEAEPASEEAPQAEDVEGGGSPRGRGESGVRSRIREPRRGPAEVVSQTGRSADAPPPSTNVTEDVEEGGPRVGAGDTGGTLGPTLPPEATVEAEESASIGEGQPVAPPSSTNPERCRRCARRLEGQPEWRPDKSLCKTCQGRG